MLPITAVSQKGNFTPLIEFDLLTYGKVVLMVLVSGLLGMALYYLGLRRTTAKTAALGEMFFPFCALGLNWLFLDASLNLTQIIGGVLLLVGSTLIQIKHY